MVRRGLPWNDAECAHRDYDLRVGTLEGGRKENHSRAQLLRPDRGKYLKSALAPEGEVEQREHRKQVTNGLDALRPVSANANDGEFGCGLQHAHQAVQDHWLASSDDDTDATRGHFDFPTCGDIDESSHPSVTVA